MLVQSKDRYRYYLLMKELQDIETTIETLRSIVAGATQSGFIEDLQKRRKEVRREMQELTSL